jgi:hypothetical protein
MAKGDEWIVFKYEWDMFCNSTVIIAQNKWTGWDLWSKNAIVESLVLHTRVLTDILLSKTQNSDDIKITDLIPGFSSPLLASLQTAYGDSKTQGCPCWQFNKLLVHATRHRSNSHDYLAALKPVCSLIVRIVAEIRATSPTPPVALD